MGKYADIKDRIKQLRLSNNLSQEDVAKKLGVSKSAVSQWERGVKQPKNEMRQALCDLFNVNLDYLNGDWNKISRLLTDDEVIMIDDYRKLNESKQLPSNIITPGAIPIPILGEICAGDGIYGEENFQGMFFIDKSVTADYCLIVHGDSMIDAGIYDGDIAFLLKDFELIDGEIYAVVFGAEDSASLKKLYRDGKTVILQPCNDSYKPIVVDYTDLYVVGLLVGVYHRMK